MTCLSRPAVLIPATGAIGCGIVPGGGGGGAAYPAADGGGAYAGGGGICDGVIGPEGSDMAQILASDPANGALRN